MKATIRARRSRSSEGSRKRAARPQRRPARTAFLAPFEPLLQQIDAARVGQVYSFYASNGWDGAAEHTVILVANDYLGLSSDPRVRAAAADAIAHFGTSRCASPLAGGHTDLHSRLEARLAAFLEQDAAVLFASGYQANVGVISALMQPHDLILTDLFNHASVVDGARLSGADVRHFQHNSAAHLERILTAEAKGRRVLVIVEGIYSADGDIAALPEICAVAHAHGALVMIDEAHSLGVLGDDGQGAAAHFGLLQDVDLIVGTLSKSLASVGGFVAADRNLVDAIAHSARALIFSAALPPAGAAAALTALEILAAEPERRQRLWRNTRAFLAGLAAGGFDTMRSVTPVIPVLIGDPLRTLELTARLRARGVLICPAIPPMVPAHLSRLRAHVTAAHELADIETALAALTAEREALGIPRKAPAAPVRAARRAVPRPARARRGRLVHTA